MSGPRICARVAAGLGDRLRARRLARVLDYADARREARRVLPGALFDYVDGGAEDEITLARNVAALRDVQLRPRMAVHNPAPDLTTRLFGSTVSLPVLTAPCGGMRLVHPQGDVGVARAAAAAGTVHVATSASGFSMEEIAADPGPKWFQLYRFYNRRAMEGLAHRAQQAGYEALVVTVDTTVSGNRERDHRNGFTYDMRINLRNALRMGPRLVKRPSWLYRYWRDGMPFELANTTDITHDGKPLLLGEMARTEGESHSPSWEDIGWIRETWRGPLVIKGVLTGEDAKRAVDAGADGIVVSNHGGRQLDGAPATIAVLPEVVAAAGPGITVLLDSGIRRGVDVLKALALGADAVLIGRHAVWGLALGGQHGVQHMIEILRADMIRAMRLMGCRSVNELDAAWLQVPTTGEVAARA